MDFHGILCTLDPESPMNTMALCWSMCSKCSDILLELLARQQTKMLLWLDLIKHLFLNEGVIYLLF